jgi:hypothetical protein
MKGHKSGVYTLLNPEKYVTQEGKTLKKIRFQTEEELNSFHALDKSNAVTRWMVCDSTVTETYINTLVVYELIDKDTGVISQKKKMLSTMGTKGGKGPLAAPTLGKFKQGYYEPQNPEKYNGPLPIIYRSSYELKVCQFFDRNINILEWASETAIWGGESVPVPYMKPTTGRVHRYFPDYIVKAKDRHGKITERLIEVKPSSQARKPRKTSNLKSYATQMTTFSINEAKWEAATRFAKEHGMLFEVLTEKEIFK